MKLDMHQTNGKTKERGTTGKKTTGARKEEEKSSGGSKASRVTAFFLPGRARALRLRGWGMEQRGAGGQPTVVMSGKGQHAAVRNQKKKKNVRKPALEG